MRLALAARFFGTLARMLPNRHTMSLGRHAAVVRVAPKSLRAKLSLRQFPAFAGGTTPRGTPLAYARP